jgi:hypothetical protein
MPYLKEMGFRRVTEGAAEQDDPSHDEQSGPIS